MRGAYWMAPLNDGLPEVPVALLRHIRTVVRVVEHVEYLDEAVDRHAAAEREPPLNAQIDAMDRHGRRGCCVA